VLFLPKYERRAASTRFRVLQYLPYLENAGFSVDVQPLLSDEYLAHRLDAGRSGTSEAVKGLFRRFLTLRHVSEYALVVICLEAMPYLPPWFEQALNRAGVPYVYDFDDAIFHQYDLHPNSLVRRLFSGKMRRVIEGATVVIAGNEYLAEYAARFNPRVTIIPTVVDVDKFLPRSTPADRERVVIGWMGSPTTVSYVLERDRVWRAVTAGGRSTLRLVGAPRAWLRNVDMESRSWREETEIADVADFDIGVMPLRDDPWSRGKCGFKLIEYLACGVAVVASPVGVNSQIVADGVTGFLCTTDAEWIHRLKQLTQDRALRRRMGEKGREVVRRHWSLQRWAPELTRVLVTVARGKA
jgi:glycosyltransferase involved in cell wall biosynthesis